MLALCGVFTASSPVYSLWCDRAWLYKLWLQPSPLLHHGLSPTLTKSLLLPATGFHETKFFDTSASLQILLVLVNGLRSQTVRQRQMESYTRTMWLHKCYFLWKPDRTGNSLKVHFMSLHIFTLWLFESIVSNLNKMYQQSCLYCAVLLVEALRKTTI